MPARSPRIVAYSFGRGEWTNEAELWVQKTAEEIYADVQRAIVALVENNLWYGRAEVAVDYYKRLPTR